MPRNLTIKYVLLVQSEKYLSPYRDHFGPKCPVYTDIRNHRDLTGYAYVMKCFCLYLKLDKCLYGKLITS